VKKLRAAVVGVGYLGRFHAQKYKQLEAELPVELVGVCDLFKDQAHKVGTELGVPAFSNPRDLIGQVDAVTISTVTRAHFEMAKTFLENGIHCNVEKPMTVTVAESEVLIETAAKNNVKLCVGHSERFNPAFQKARELIKSPHVIELTRHAPYKTRGADVSVIHDLMIHDLDLLRTLVPTDLQLVEAQGGKLISPSLDWAQAVFQFGGTRQAIISVSRVAPVMTRTLRILAAQESVLCDLQTGDVQWAQFQNPETPVIQTMNVGKGDNLLSETRAFIQAVLGHEPNLSVPGIDGLRAMEWVHRLMDRIGAQ
jgi:predicted dehydrogenase